MEEGKIKYVGLSEVGPDDLRAAHEVHPITAVQLEWSLWTRDVEASSGPSGCLLLPSPVTCLLQVPSGCHLLPDRL